MVWPANPTQYEDIPMLKGEWHTVMSAQTEAVLCRFVTEHVTELESLTEGNKSKEQVLGSLLVTAFHRAERSVKLQSGLEV